MYSQFIDTVQNGKKQAVETFVSDKTVKTELVKLIDAQTKFYKGWVDTTINLAETLVSSVNNPFVVKGA